MMTGAVMVVAVLGYVLLLLLCCCCCCCCCCIFHRGSRGRACGSSRATRAAWRMFHSLFIKIIDRIVYY